MIEKQLWVNPEEGGEEEEDVRKRFHDDHENINLRKKITLRLIWEAHSPAEAQIPKIHVNSHKNFDPIGARVTLY